MGSKDTDGERKEERIGAKRRELHELPVLYIKIVKFGTIRLASGFFK